MFLGVRGRIVETEPNGRQQLPFFLIGQDRQWEPNLIMVHPLRVPESSFVAKASFIVRQIDRRSGFTPLTFRRFTIGPFLGSRNWLARHSTPLSSTILGRVLTALQTDASNGPPAAVASSPPPCVMVAGTPRPLVPNVCIVAKTRKIARRDRHCGRRLAA